jgi:hypothetical protein
MSQKLTRQNRVICAAHQFVSRRVSVLIQERAELEEEVRQLRAAVQIWAAVAEQKRPVSAEHPSSDQAA